jgi:predicted HicB family RNase H-like nuclease
MSEYRMLVTFSSETERFTARVAELAGCEADGETRAEAIEALETELEAQIANMKEQDVQPPQPLDTAEYSGEISLKVSPELHRDLTLVASDNDVELPLLLTELLTRAVRPPRRQSQGRRREGNDNRRRREGGGRQYHNIMENRADFIEYVRGLDGPGGGGSGGRGGGRGRGRRGAPKDRGSED